MALKNINDKNLVENDIIKYYCKKCNKNVAMRIVFTPKGISGKCPSCKEDIILKKNENYIPEEKEIIEKNIPKCPTCGSTNLKKVSGASKAISVAMWGFLSQKVKKQFHCNNCGYEW